MSTRCPVHDMSDCSPLLNGCDRLTNPPQKERTMPEPTPAAEVEAAVEMTPESWREFFLERTEADQLTIAGQVLENSHTATHCMLTNHQQQIDTLRARLQQLLTVVEEISDDVLELTGGPADTAVDMRASLSDDVHLPAARRLRNVAVDIATQREAAGR